MVQPKFSYPLEFQLVKAELNLQCSRHRPETISAATHSFKVEDGPNLVLNKASGKRNALCFQTPHLLSPITSEEH